MRSLFPAPLLLSLLMLSTVYGSTAWAQQSTASARKELESLQQEIKQTERQRRDQRQALKRAEAELKKADQVLAEASQAVRAEQDKLQTLQQQQQQLEQQQQQLEQQRQQQQQLLAAQVKAAYQVGGHDYTQLLLNQQDASKLERLLTYYQYFNNARMQQLTALKTTVDELAALKQQADSNRLEQEQRLAQLTAQQQELAAARKNQHASVQQLQALLQDQKQQLEYLKSNEQSLQATIAKLKAQAANRRLKHSGKTGSLPWPVKGAISQQFGAQQGGGMTASGVIIQAPTGTAVKAVADGQVIYADWLKGYGWVTVVDHGNGLMSLYGNNQTLLKTPGEVVKSGDTLALVGQSGGQNAAGLYFEIRQKGSAVNPLRWLRAP
ncbi:murein hydrolase activator EnvC family protein [Rheinheimera sp.]|uniref:murein hydrolase activator EnvC family protein n=1 Tax=Rheinheimera sp. TaxID=1869214 RepID=UPI0025EE898B|nr:peptidoglycan DD-metalloendopeptidase family protein [Rheinheimera sp.]